MLLKQSEAIVLRTYPLREADLLVTLFTRAEGKIKGVCARRQRENHRFRGPSRKLGRAVRKTPLAQDDRSAIYIFCRRCTSRTPGILRTPTMMRSRCLASAMSATRSTVA